MSENNDQRRLQIIEVMSGVLRLSPDIVAGGVTPQEVEHWDSQTHVVLVIALEEVFGIMFEPEDVAELTSLDSIDEIIQRHGT